MQQELLSQARHFVQRAAAAGHRGRTADPVEIDSLEAAIGRPLPEWLRTIMTTVPLIGLEMGVQSLPAEAEFDGVEWLVWLSPKDICWEAVDGYPGIDLLPHGYLCVAGECIGSGDQYYIRLDQRDDPPLLQVYHDSPPWTDEAGNLEADASRVVAPSLSKLFETARPAS